MSWRQKSIDAVVSVLESGSRPKGGASADSGEIPSLGGENILKHGGITLEEVKRVPRQFYERMTKGHLKNSDVLINKDGAQTGKVGFYENAYNVDACINEHLFLIRGNAELITQSYLYYSLLSQACQNQIEAQISGSAQPGLKSNFLVGLYTELPESLSEQSKIAEVLSKVDQAIEQTENLIAKQQRIKTGLMQDLLTRGIDEHGNLRSEETHQFKDSPLGRIPVEWKLLKLSDLASVERGKFTHRPRDDVRFYGGSFPFIQTGDVTSRIGRTVDSYIQTLSEKGKRVSKEFPKGSIAVTIAANIADTAILGLAMYFPDSVVGVIVKHPNSIRYIELSIRRWKPVLERMAPKSAQRNINLEVLRPLIIATPTPEEQEEIAAVYECAEAKHILLEKSREKLRPLKTALMQDLLTGRVRVTPLIQDTEAIP